MFDNHRDKISLIDRTILIPQLGRINKNRLDRFLNDPNLITPINVNISLTNPNKYVIIDGQHRFIAAIVLGWETINTDSIDF